MSKHTRGPWITSRSLHWPMIGGPPRSVWTGDRRRSHRSRICTVERRREEFEANARLIAAAPELLAACTRTAEIIQGGDRFESLEPWAQEIVQSLNAAIAKAEGREVPHA